MHGLKSLIIVVCECFCGTALAALEISWSVMHPTAIDANYMARLVEKVNEIRAKSNEPFILMADGREFAVRVDAQSFERLISSCRQMTEKWGLMCFSVSALGSNAQV